MRTPFISLRTRAVKMCQNIRRESVERRTTQESIDDRRDSLLLHSSTVEPLGNAGDELSTYLWNLDYSIHLFDEDSSDYVAVTLARERVCSLIHLFGPITDRSRLHRSGISFRLILARHNWFGPTRTRDEAISTRFFGSIVDALHDLRSKVESQTLKYDTDDDLIVDQIYLLVRRSNQANAAASHMRRTEANKFFFIPGEYTTTKNCFYHAWEICKKPSEFFEATVTWIDGERKGAAPSVKDQAKQSKKTVKINAKKRGLELHTGFSNDDDIKLKTSMQRAPSVQLYDGQFRKIDFFGKKNDKGNPIPNAHGLLHIQRSQNHYRPMIPWSQLGDDARGRYDKALEKTISSQIPEQETIPFRRLPSTRFKASVNRNLKIVAYDFETALNEDQGFEGYGAAAAWYRRPFSSGDSVDTSVAEPPFQKDENGNCYLDGGDEMCYVAFWGPGCIMKLVEFMWKHAKYFTGSTWYAHNGGKFDLPLMMREAFFDFDIKRCRIGDEKQCTILNGRWIAFQIVMMQGGDDYEIDFRDSFALLAGSLDKLIKDYACNHKKLGDVDHDKITLHNWHTFPQLEPYLRHDCFGLLELLNVFSRDIFDMSWTVKLEENHCERDVANILEVLLGLNHLSFTKQRPAWCKTKQMKKALELDGYCEEAQVAFEYNGEEHYNSGHWFYRNDPFAFKERQRHDKVKQDQCAANNVDLLVVPYTVYHDRDPFRICLVSFIKEWLRNNSIQHKDSYTPTPTEIKRERVIDEGGINITDVRTASGISKRLFLNKYYKPRKFEIYSLSKHIDAYIRQAYFGGRVEVFQLGVIHGPVYYLDFTSLYPAMGCFKLPYGEPRHWSSSDFDAYALAERLNWGGRIIHVLPPKFFGFVRCMVRSTALGKTKMVLHGVKNAQSGGKLLFAHLDDWRELTLFSEEIRKGEREGLYEYKPIDGCDFKAGECVKDFFQDCFKVKSEAKRQGKPAKEKAVKIIANSGYGWLGLKTNDKESIKIFPSGDVPVYDYLARDALIEECNQGQYTVLRVSEDMNVQDFNVADAAAVTSYARMQLYDLMQGIKDRGGKVHSCDTDSVCTDLDMSLYPDFLRKFIPDWNTDEPGAELGSLKCECTDEVTKVLKKHGVEGEALRQSLAQLRGSTAWKPMPFFHPEGTMTTVANKLYSLRTIVKGRFGGMDVDKLIDLCKAKGMTKGKFTFEDYANAFAHEGALYDVKDPPKIGPSRIKAMIDEDQKQFKMGLAHYHTDGGLVPVTMHRMVKKAFPSYTKGEINPETGEITPFTI